MSSEPAGPTVAIVGSGAVARALARALHVRGVALTAVVARDPVRARAAAAGAGPDVAVVAAADLPRLATCVVVAVSDEAIPVVAAQLASAGLRSGVVLHTCGASGPEALAPLPAAGVACGVFHPLQTFPPHDDDPGRLSGITFAVGGDPQAVRCAETLAGQLGSRTLQIAADGFPAYHAAAALAGNGIAALVDSALALMARAGVDAAPALEALAPLCRASVSNVLAQGPERALTGPVARGDVRTVEAHVTALSDVPDDVDRLYRAVTARLVTIARRRGLPDTTALRLTRLAGGTAAETT